MKNQSIYKYPLKQGFFTNCFVDVPIHSKFLSLDRDCEGNICAWFMVYPEVKETKKVIFVEVMTGQKIDDNILACCNFIKTMVDPVHGIVSHWFVDKNC